MTVAERLQRLIARRKTSQSNVADAAGMSRQQVGRIVSGSITNPGIVTIERIVEAIGVSMAELYREESADTSAPQTSMPSSCLPRK